VPWNNQNLFHQSETTDWSRYLPRTAADSAAAVSTHHHHHHHQQQHYDVLLSCQPPANLLNTPALINTAAKTDQQQEAADVVIPNKSHVWNLLGDDDDVVVDDLKSLYDGGDDYQKIADWSIPDVSWYNVTNDEWRAPVPHVKPSKTYFVSGLYCCFCICNFTNK